MIDTNRLNSELVFMHIDKLIDHSNNKISLGGWLNFGVFHFCHRMFKYEGAPTLLSAR